MIVMDLEMELFVVEERQWLENLWSHDPKPMEGCGLDLSGCRGYQKKRICGWQLFV